MTCRMIESKSRKQYEEQRARNKILLKRAMTGDEKTSVVLTVEREGSYVSSTAGVVLEMVCDEVCPLSVSLDEETIRYFTDGNDFEKARDDKNSAWYYDAEKHKAKIYYPRPKADYKVEINFLRHDLIGM